MIRRIFNVDYSFLLRDRLVHLEDMIVVVQKCTVLEPNDVITGPRPIRTPYIGILRNHVAVQASSVPRAVTFDAPPAAARAVAQPGVHSRYNIWGLEVVVESHFKFRDGSINGVPDNTKHFFTLVGVLLEPAGRDVPMQR